MSRKMIDCHALRDPGEKKLLKRTCMLLGISYTIVCGLTLSLFLGWIIVAFLTVAVLRSRYLAEAIEVNDDQFPRLWELVRKCAAQLDEPAPKVYVTAEPGNWPIYTVPVPEPAILVHSNFLRMLSDEELEYYIYHELAHGKLGHRTFLNPINVLENVGPISWILTTPLEVMRFALRPWLRLADSSADRVALACIGGRVDVAASALARVTAGEEIYSMVDAHAFLAQARRLEHSKLLALYEIATGRLGNARRLSWLAEFSESEGFAQLCEPVEQKPRRNLLKWFGRKAQEVTELAVSRPARSTAMVALLLLALTCPVRSETLILNNGLKVEGYIVGAKQGNYLVQIGSYTKRVPQESVKQILDDDAPPPAATTAAPSLGGSASLSSLLSNLGGGQSGGGAGSLSALLGGMGGGQSPGGNGASLQQLMGALSGSGRGPATGGAGLESLLGGMNLGDLQGGTGGQAGLSALADRFQKAEFQEKLLSQLESLNQNGPNPGAATEHIKLLRGLFGQLNATAAPAKPSKPSKRTKSGK